MSEPSEIPTFFDADADRMYVEPVPARQPWDMGRVRLTHVLREDSGGVASHVLDLTVEDARLMACTLVQAASEVGQEDALAVREGDRIRSTRDDSGYVDSVSDENIQRHLKAAEETLRRALDDARFCQAVLALREEERRVRTS